MEARLGTLYVGFVHCVWTELSGLPSVLDVQFRTFVKPPTTKLL